MAQSSVRLWVKKQLRLDLLNFNQRDMVEIGAAGLLSVKKRLREARGPSDAPARPLSKRYAIQKSKARKGNKRDLWLTGKMLGNLQLRTLKGNMAQAALTSRLDRIKGIANDRREPWLVFSPTNRHAVMEKAKEVFSRKIKNLVTTKAGTL